MHTHLSHLSHFEKFLPTRLLGPTRLLNFKISSHLRCYSDSTLIRHFRVNMHTKCLKCPRFFVRHRDSSKFSVKCFLARIVYSADLKQPAWGAWDRLRRCGCRGWTDRVRIIEERMVHCDQFCITLSKKYQTLLTCFQSLKSWLNIIKTLKISFVLIIFRREKTLVYK